MKSRICMKFIQYISFYAFITNIYSLWTDHLIVIIYAIFNLWDLWGFLENWTIFLMTSFPVKMTSPQSSFQWKSRSWVDLSAKKNFWVDWTNQLLAEFMTRHPTFQISTFEKTHISRKYPPTKPRFPLSRQRWIRW